MRSTWIVLLLVPLAGCLSSAPDAEEPEPLEARPWFNAWTVLAATGDLFFDPEERTMGGTATYFFENRRGEAMPEMEFLMPITRSLLVRDSAGNELATEVARGMQLPTIGDYLDTGRNAMQVVTVTLQGSADHGARQTITVEWEGWSNSYASVPGTPSNTGMFFGSLMPITSFQRGQIGTAWWNVTLATPDTWTILPTGVHVSNTATDDGLLWDVRSNVGYVSVVASKGTGFHQSQVGHVDVRTYFYPGDQVQAQRIHDINVRSVDFIGDVLAPFPYDHIWVHPLQTETANAFSITGISLLSTAFYQSVLEGLPVQFGRFTPYPGGADGFELVTVHENVHNVWGSQVRGNVSRTDERNEVWITEGITTYLSEMVWYEHQYGPHDAAASARAKVLDQGERAVGIGQEGCGVNTRCGDYYEQAALGLRALQAYGIATDRPTVVLDALRAVWLEFGRDHGGDGGASHEEVQATFERVFGEELSWHFDPWFWTGELAQFVPQTFTDNGTTYEVVVMNEGPVRAAAHVQVLLANGDRLDGWSVIDGGSPGTIVLDVPGPLRDQLPMSVEVDPWAYVWESNETDNVLLLA